MNLARLGRGPIFCHGCGDATGDRDPWDTDPEDDELIEDTYDHFVRNGQNSY